MRAIAGIALAPALSRARERESVVPGLRERLR